MCTRMPCRWAGPLNAQTQDTSLPHAPHTHTSPVPMPCLQHTPCRPLSCAARTCPSTKQFVHCPLACTVNTGAVPRLLLERCSWLLGPIQPGWAGVMAQVTYTGPHTPAGSLSTQQLGPAVTRPHERRWGHGGRRVGPGMNQNKFGVIPGAPGGWRGPQPASRHTSLSSDGACSGLCGCWEMGWGDPK